MSKKDEERNKKAIRDFNKRLDAERANDCGTEETAGGVHGNDAPKVYCRRISDDDQRLTTDGEVMYLNERWQWNRYPTGKAVWDTGADMTAITQEVADALGIVVTEWRNVGSIGGNSVAGRARVNIRLGDIVLPFWEVNIIDLAEREQEARRMGVPYSHPDVWIGMDVIGLGRLTVDSTSGETVLTFEMPTL